MTGVGLWFLTNACSVSPIFGKYFFAEGFYQIARLDSVYADIAEVSMQIISSFSTLLTQSDTDVL